MRIINIFTPQSKDTASQPFYLFPDTVAVIQGFNFDGAKVSSPRSTNGTKFTPAACLNMVKLTPYTIPDNYRSDEGGWYYIPTANSIEYSGPICTGGKPWSINVARTMALLDVPGDYQFILNHDSLLGVIELIAYVYPKMDFGGTEAKTLYLGG